MRLGQALSERGLLGLQFGDGRSDVVETLGEPENWTRSRTPILMYGDLQLCFDASGVLWLATIWITSGRLRMQGRDIRVEWRLSPNSLSEALVAVGLTVKPVRLGELIPLAAVGPHYKAEAQFDEDSLLQKLSLVGLGFRAESNALGELPRVW